MTKLYANPYDISANGFYFESVEEFKVKSDSLRNQHGDKVEEFEINFIDGDLAELFNVCGIDQSNLEIWFDTVESMDDHEKVALFYLLDNGNYKDLDGCLDKYSEVQIVESNLIDAAIMLFDECYASEIPDTIKSYIDYEKFANDCQQSGDMNEFQYDGSTYTCTNACAI